MPLSGVPNDPPLWREREERVNREDLLKFCSDDRDELREPWTTGEYSYATNGNILIRVPRLADVPPRKLPLGPKMLDKIFPLPEPKRWLRVDRLQFPARDFTTCPECMGADRCPEKGFGFPGCTPLFEPMEVGGAWFNSDYLFLLASLPDCRIGPMEPLVGAPFRFGGGDGMLMPMKRYEPGVPEGKR